jgi:hypothetical protein
MTVADTFLNVALPLPRYVRRKRLASGKHGYFFSVPTKFRRAGCDLRDEALGVDYDEAVQRAEQVLLPALDAWTSGATRPIPAPIRVHPSTVQPLIGVYLLMQGRRLIYIGSSLNMPNRVAEHRRNGRPFDKAFFIETEANERGGLEQALIRALHPSQNRAHRARASHQADDDAAGMRA